MQLSLFPEQIESTLKVEITGEIERYIIAFSGGKDSVCLLLWAIENIPIEKIEVWHHLIDSDSGNFMDWEVTLPYVKAVCKYLNVPLYLSWLEGGFKGELMRNNEPKKQVWYETPDGLKSSGGKGKNNTRLRFPAKGSNHQSRWCSSYLKIDVCKASINNQARFKNAKIVVLTGERRSESPSRSKYNQTQYYIQPTKHRTVYQYRAIIDYSEEEVWKKMGEYKIRPHPAYSLGFSRVSCRACIFSNPDQWATIKRDYPAQFAEISRLESSLNHTIDNRYSIEQLAQRGSPYPLNPALVAIATSREYKLPIYDPDWKIPIGAFQGNSGGS
jgi:3'-phosphoadenosine 5'-phosphosulfate sulfotransferase (PAPS reductase)/FAD synthetase